MNLFCFFTVKRSQTNPSSYPRRRRRRVKLTGFVIGLVSVTEGQELGVKFGIFPGAADGSEGGGEEGRISVLLMRRTVRTGQRRLSRA